MKKLVLILCAALMLVACNNTEKQLRERAAELCKYIPDHELLEQSKNYMTEDFYAVLDTMFNHLPSHEAMDHEWLYYFVTGNGGTIADYEVVKDNMHIHLVERDLDADFVQFVIDSLVEIEKGFPIISIFCPDAEFKADSTVGKGRYSVTKVWVR